MAANRNRYDKSDSTLRNVAEPYIVHLQNEDYTLTEEDIKKCADSGVYKATGWFFPKLHLVSFRQGIAELTNTVEKVTYKLFIKVEKDKLHVSCSCATQVEKLCLHAYKALDKLLLYSTSTDYFTHFKPGRLVETAFAYKKYFEIDTKDHLPIFKPKVELGSIYGIKDKLVGYSINDVLLLPATPPPATSEKKDITICYILMVARRDDLLPFLVPCLGKLNKYGDEIKNFNNFLSGTEKAYEPFLTDAQKTLNGICFELWQLVENLPGRLIRENISFDEPDKLIRVFELWQQAIPLLQNEFVYKHAYFQKKQLKKNPSKSWSYKINIQKDKPEIQFQLADKGAFYQLEMQVYINGKSVKKHEIIDEFFIEDTSRGNVYMLPSLRDAGVAEWMARSKNRITVFKEQFPAFENNFLLPLQKYYTVKITGKPSGLTNKSVTDV